MSKNDQWEERNLFSKTVGVFKIALQKRDRYLFKCELQKSTGFF